MINWKHTTREDIDIMVKIAKRTLKMAIDYDIRYDQMTAVMDLQCVHGETPLKLQDLLAADDLNFAHDVFGIRNNLNRDTGKLENCFSPRYTL
jgi:hypothetical protein